MVVQTITRFTIYTKPELIELVARVAKETKTSRSKVVSQCLEELARKRKEALMIKYYETMAQEHRDFDKKSVKVIQKIASSWSD